MQQIVWLHFFFFFFSVAQSFGSARYEAGTGSILQDDVTCTGSEISLMDCPHVNSTNHNCRHSEDVGVRCEFPKSC